MDVQFMDDVDDPIFAISLQNEAGHYRVRRQHRKLACGHRAFRSREHGAEVRVRSRTSSRPGRYRLIATVARAGLGADVFDAHISSSIIVIADRPGGGMADLPHRFEIERRQALDERARDQTGTALPRSVARAAASSS